jgi:formylglycine-generating enzyme required for sulfatase activity
MGVCGEREDGLFDLRVQWEQQRGQRSVWYAGNSGSTTHPVGTKMPNSLGLYDMNGNVEEWCWDWYGGYSNGAQTDPVGASSGTDRVFRGGGWDAAAAGARSASRGRYTPSYRGSILGFRFVRPLF